MADLKLIQFGYETHTWKRLLLFMIEENIHLKIRLSEILQQIPGVSLLEDLENFQNRFIRQDQFISLLRDDIAELDGLLVREIFEDGKVINEIDRKLLKLRNNILHAEMQFSKLKLDFNNFLLGMCNDCSGNESAKKNDVDLAKVFAPPKPLP
jgi:hypothetical protein